MLDGLRDQYPQPFEARIYADTGPINERVLAKHAGLGWLGKNTLLLNERIGSFFFLGVILTTLDLPSTSELPMLRRRTAAVPAANVSTLVRRRRWSIPTLWMRASAFRT